MGKGAATQEAQRQAARTGDTWLVITGVSGREYRAVNSQYEPHHEAPWIVGIAYANGNYHAVDTPEAAYYYRTVFGIHGAMAFAA